MTRAELIEVMARAMLANELAVRPTLTFDPAWQQESDIWLSNATAALSAIEAAGVRLVPTTWTDDDQTGLNAAVYDAMWHWEDRPIDVDDAMSLALAIKASISENGLMIVSASPYAKENGQ